MDLIGQIVTDPDFAVAADNETLCAIELITVIQRAKVRPFTTKSDFAREWANPIALCACEGLITTQLNEGTYTNVWMVTSDGLDWAEEAATHVLGD